MTRIIRGERAGSTGRLAVGCSAAVFDPPGKRILLMRRADSGRWDVPGGFMEPGEGVRECCAREVLEETGLHVQVRRLAGVYTNPHIVVEYADGNRWQFVALIFEADVIGGTLRGSEESTEVGFFSREEIERMDLECLGRTRVEDAFSRQAAAFVRDDIELG